MRKLSISFLLAVLVASMLYSKENPEKKVYHTTSIAGQPTIEIDGILDEGVWGRVGWASEFIQYDPDDGALPSRQTRFKILYDTENIYVAFHCLDEDPDKIVKRMSRRDGFPGDWVEINIDSYFDKRTAFSFTTSVSGVKGDEFISNNGNNWDTNWNPIWYSAAHVVDDGWTAEIRIPLSQLRYGNKDEHVWGIQVMRRDFRAGERSTWQHIPRNSSGWVSQFGELRGIKNIKSQRQLELQPYSTASVETFEKVEGDPFNDGADTNLGIGLDGKIGITSDLTLDFSVNPDFGQVEADPSALTLDGFQIFFEEKRPFFIEGNNLFNFSISRAQAGGPFGNDNLFYSRRIGRSPQGNIAEQDGTYIDRPEFTSILAAAKFSGKTKTGWSVGLMESVTAEEKQHAEYEGTRSKSIIEPLSNYFVSRLARDIGQGSTVIGGMLTSVNRKLENTGLEDQFHSSALSGGLDVLHTWKNREWQIAGNFIFSNVQGSPNKIENTQTSFEHYFQRPDASHLNLDPAKTSLTGHGGNLSIANYGGPDNISFESGLTWRSPELELNDIGFMNIADEINHYTWVGYRYPSPFSIFRSFRINYNHWLRWTFGGTNTYQAINMNAHMQFKNQWSLSMGSTYEFKDISTKALFGGPLLRNSNGLSPWIFIGTDSRKLLSFSFHSYWFEASGINKGALNVKNYSVSARYQPTNSLNFSISPSYFQQDRVIQNVSSAEYKENIRYITGTVKQQTFSISMRLNYNITPNLTVQYWGQPFISKAIYNDYKYITDPLAEVYTDRFELYTEDQIKWSVETEQFEIDENIDGNVDYAFGDPDINFLQFRSNLVIRWEYIPGSELYIVWSQSNTNLGDPEKGILPSLQDDLFGKTARNIFLLKWTYRFLN